MKEKENQGRRRMNKMGMREGRRNREDRDNGDGGRKTGHERTPPYLCFIDAVDYRLISQRGIQCAQGEALFEAPHGRDKPLLPCLGEDDDVLLGLVTEDSQAPSEVGGHSIDFTVG